MIEALILVGVVIGAPLVVAYGLWRAEQPPPPPKKPALKLLPGKRGER